MTAALLLLAATFWLSEMGSPAILPGPAAADAAGACGSVPVQTCFQCLQQVRLLLELERGLIV